MPVPDFQSLMLPLLKLFAEGKTNVAQCLPALQREFAISDEEAAELNPSGTMTTFANRTHWARTYMSKAGLLTSPSRNRHLITDAGRQFLASGATRIDIRALEQLPTYVEWREKDGESAKGQSTTTLAVPVTQSQETPEERIAVDFNSVESSLRDDLLAAVVTMPPQKFEQLIVDLLLAMG